jgi:hypothetical protein
MWLKLSVNDAGMRYFLYAKLSKYRLDSLSYVHKDTVLLYSIELTRQCDNNTTHLLVESLHRNVVQIGNLYRNAQVIRNLFYI